MLPMIKLLLKINQTDTSQDPLLTYLINITQRKILNYCNLIELPTELESILIEMVVNEYRNQYTQNAQGAVKSETIGDYKIEYATSSTSTSSLDDYKSQLNQFRKVKFI